MHGRYIAVAILTTNSGPPREWVATLDKDATVAIVGHEPHLSRLVAWLLTGKPSDFITMKKGGACLLEFEKGARQSGGTLAWLLRPSQLADLAR